MVLRKGLKAENPNIGHEVDQLSLNSNLPVKAIGTRPTRIGFIKIQHFKIRLWKRLELLESGDLKKVERVIKRFMKNGESSVTLHLGVSVSLEFFY